MTRRTKKMDPALAGVLNDPRFRISVLGVFFAVGFLVLLGRLYCIQVLSGTSHLEQVSSQSVRRIRIPNRRGRIITRDNVVLAGNRQEFDLVFYPEEMKKRRRSDSIVLMYDNALRAAAMVGRENTVNVADIRRHLIRRPGIPFTVMKNLSQVEMARAYEFTRMTPGSDVTARETRTYPQGRTACHLVGYTGLEERKTAPDREEFFYYIPDTVGREGIEKAFDTLPDKRGTGLRGYPGYSLIQVDKLGYAHNRIIHEIAPSPGADVVLTLDFKAQTEAERLLTGHRGAMVLLDADNGEVLAAASAPGYDLARFAPSVPAAYYRVLRNDPDNPLFHRAFSASYTPGSIMKPAVMLALLTAGVSPDEIVNCDGASRIGDAKIRCAAHRRGGHGEVNSCNAINWSCNDYMIEQAVKHPAELLFEVMKSSGVGRRTGVEIPDARGVAPGFAEKRRRYRYGWTKYDTALLSIGQGIISISPLQAAVYCAALANGGTVYKPRLVQKVIDRTGVVTWQSRPEELSRIKASSQAFETVKRGMYDVVNSPTGSGRRGRVEGLEIYGKTGSAEIGRRGNLKIIAWFIAYTRYNGRNYALAAVIEEGSSGGSLCAPLAGRFFRSYLKPQKSSAK